MNSENMPNVPVNKVVRRRKVRRRNVDELINNSGKGNVPVIKVVSDKFNWAAFLMPILWGLFNNANKTAFVLIPGLIVPVLLGLCKNSVPALVLAPLSTLCSLSNIVLCIWCGIKGNTWAWQNKRYKSIEHFHSVQKNWAIGSILFLFVIPITLIIFAVPMFSRYYKLF